MYQINKANKMKTLFFALLMIIAGSTITIAQESYKLSVTVSEIQNITGNILLMVCNEENFMKGSVKIGMTKVEGEKATIEIDELPAGEYAIMLFQDENGNYQPDKDERGVPTESFGFSGDVASLMQAPTFDQCKFTVNGDSSITVKLQRIGNIAK